MHGTYEQNKASYKRYVNKNRQRINAIQMRSYHKKQLWIKISKEFFNILLS